LEDAVQEITDVSRLRLRICMLLAITFASTASAWAATAHIAPMVPPQHATMNMAVDMSDCDRMMHLSKAVVPDCDHGKSCADKFCVTKCFEIFGALPEMRLSVVMLKRARPGLLPRSAT
jgi:hypothetical protein